MIYIGIDDTDTLESRGTGRLARMIADYLGGPVVGVIRHQLFQDPRVPYTKKNSAACISLFGDDLEPSDLIDPVTRFMREHFQNGSDPGLCIARDVPSPVMAYGKAVKRSVVSQNQARDLARDYDIPLLGMGGNEDGVIGALAAVGLAAEGNDGRYIQVGSVRALSGFIPISDVLQAGVDAVKTLQGITVQEGLINAEKLRPSRRARVPVLYVEKKGDHWNPLKID